MSRYPGTQFIVHDNSQATATVPVANTNISDSVQYLQAFGSVKGPEGITLVSGEDFYTKFGSQANVDFKKYGQPLLQTSMNINNGAAVLAKRAVLDDATLGNATLAVVLTKYKDATITVDPDNPSRIKKIEYNAAANVGSKYSLAPMVFSVNNTNDYNIANATVTEYKERYELYKKFVEKVVSNENNSNNEFLNRLGVGVNVLSGFAQSVYYDEDGNIIPAGSPSSVRKISSVTTGYSIDKKTVSANFDAAEITGATGGTARTVTNTDTITGAEIWIPEYKTDTKTIVWKKTTGTTATYVNIANLGIALERVLPMPADASTIAEFLDKEITNFHPEWTGGTYDLSGEYAVLIPEETLGSTEGYVSVEQLMNGLMVKNSNYIEAEYVFPVFTVFDNGRGESTKTIGIGFDAPTSSTLKKAVYTLSVADYNTGLNLEKYSFCVNPYARNTVNGYTFDIESAVNNTSNQISVKTYYESYDALLETLQEILNTTDTAIVENNDILFGHALTGKYPVYNSYEVSAGIRKFTNVYDYARLDVFGNNVITVNAVCDCDNMSELDANADIKYYFYNASRIQRGICERLEMGSNGNCTERTVANNATKVAFVVIDSEEISDETSMSMVDLMDLSGQVDGAIITDETGDLQNKPVVESNFVKCKLRLAKADVYTNGVKGATVYITNNAKTLERKDVIDSSGTTTNFTGYKITASTTEVVEVYIPMTPDYLYQEQYRRFYNGEFDRDIYNLDVYFPNAVFDANYSNATKMAIQRLAAYRGDFMAYMDMGINKVLSYSDAASKVPSFTSGTRFDGSDVYVNDMHIAVTCLSYKIRNPYDNKVIPVTATYGLSNLYVGHFRNDVAKVFAGISNGITINNIVDGTVSYVPKIYPTSNLVSINNINGVYPTDDETVMNEKQLMSDLRVNYGCFYDNVFSIETEYTRHPAESEFSYWNNVALVCRMMQDLRRACPAARYQFVTADDLSVYKTAIETAMKPWRNRFAKLTFKYVKDSSNVVNKTYYAAIEVAFKQFAQSEIFELTALNYSTLSDNVTTI